MENTFQPTPIISLGAGVQSTTVYIMSCIGLLRRALCAVFADTQGEPAEVYAHLEYLEREFGHIIPIERVTAGDLASANLVVRRSKKSGKIYHRNLIPFYTLEEDGKKGMLPRKCTADYKIRLLVKAARRIGRVPRGSKTVLVQQWIGISTDEASRMKPSREPWIENIWPLIDLGMSRDDCTEWLVSNGHPLPPKSACEYCPFHSDAHWKEMKEHFPERFARVVAYERDCQTAHLASEVSRGKPFLHEARIPLDQIVFSSDGRPSRMGNECEGICGV